MMNNFICFDFINEFWKLLRVWFHINCRVFRFSTSVELIVCKSEVTPVRPRSSVLHNVTRRSNEPPLSNVVVVVSYERYANRQRPMHLESV